MCQPLSATLAAVLAAAAGTRDSHPQCAVDGPRPVRAGSGLALVFWPERPQRHPGVKRDFACAYTRHFSPVLIVLRSQSRLRLEGRTRTLSGAIPGSKTSRG